MGGGRGWWVCGYHDEGILVDLGVMVKNKGKTKVKVESKSRLKTMMKERKRKLEEIKKLGVDPYLAKYKRTHSAEEVREVKDKAEVSVAGRIMGWREHGGATFADVKDESGRIQIYFQEDKLGKKSYEFLRLLDVGDFVGLKGEKFVTQKGEPTIRVSEYKLLTKALRPIPSTWHGLKDIEERYRKRYLDLILNEGIGERLLVRGRVISSIRELLDERGFVEVETPTLQPVYGGGFAKPFVTHHNVLDADFFLRISDEMYLKRLIVGGFEKVYEITKVFRNEGVDYDHNPEFTMFEAMIAYEDYKYGMDLIEEIMERAAKEAVGTTRVKCKGVDLDFKRPWERMKLVEAVRKHSGVDVLAWKTVEEARKEVAGVKGIGRDKLGELKKMRKVGEVIAFVFEEVVEEKLVQPTIIYDYPVEISPLAKRCEDPRFTQRFEMFAMGSELGNNYSELTDAEDLRRRFVEEKEREKAGFEEAHQTDEDYLEAIESGFPPTCGIAIGIDRFVMMLTDAQNIREVIAFPTLRPKEDLG
jgi:lysyl-tRNA synthetase class 2